MNAWVEDVEELRTMRVTILLNLNFSWPLDGKSVTEFSKEIATEEMFSNNKCHTRSLS